MTNFLSKFFLFSTIFILPGLVLVNKAQAQTCSPNPPDNDCSVTNSVNVSANVSESSVTFSGFSPSGALVTFKENQVVIGTTIANSSGSFSKTTTATSGTHNYKIYLTDTNGLSTPEISISNVSVTNHTNTLVPNIHLPPTITLSETRIDFGRALKISGQAAPGSTIHLFLNGSVIYSQTIDQSSVWNFNLSKNYKLGQNSLYANLTRTGIPQSEKSEAVSFVAQECKKDCTPLPPEEETPLKPTPDNPDPTQKNSYDIDVSLGFDLGKNLTLILLTGIATSQFLLIILVISFVIFSRKRKKRKEQILRELEEKVEKDISKDHTRERIEKDFWEAERELEG